MNKDTFRGKLIEIMRSNQYPKTDLSNFIKFLGEVKNFTECHETMPRSPNLEKIKNTGEAAFQRAIFNEKNSILKFNSGITKEVGWLDLELPVSFSPGDGRRKCVDLIGLVDGKPLVCELKFMKEFKGDSPEYGIFELLMYYTLILYNKENLDHYKVKHNFGSIEIKWKWESIDCDKPILLFCANEKYWNYWRNKLYQGNKEKQIDVFELVRVLNQKLSVSIFLFETEDVDFQEQLEKQKKSGGDVYNPTVHSKVWVEVRS